MSKNTSDNKNTHDTAEIRHDRQETFIVKVQHQHNSTWQGKITWAEKNKTMNFRSLWEMIHLMEDAIGEED